MGMALNPSSVGDGGDVGRWWCVCWRELSMLSDFFRASNNFRFLQVEFVAAWWIYSIEMSV